MTATEEIRAKVDLVALIGETVALKASGQNFKATCPFHNERTPSFYVFPDRQVWHCFGACATGGDAFSFVMRRDSLGFTDAMKLLAARAGVQFETSDASRARAGKLDELRAINRSTAMYFHEMLLSAPEAAHAREHLEKRGISKETIQDYRLGYSPEGGAGLLKLLTNEGHNEDALIAAGVFRKRNEGPGSYPFFRGRLMVPILDARSDYVGFGARALDDAKPKYLNTGQTALFDKSSVLYGLHRGADAIKQQHLAVLVEGYMDVLMAHQYGFRNVVAAMGTALSDRQVAALKRLANTFVLALDPDAAGDEATLRSLESSWKILDQPVRPMSQALLTGPDTAQDLVLKVMDLPRGVDPDDVIRGDPAQWTALIAQATPVIDYVFNAMAKRSDLTTPRGKASMTQRLAPFIYQTSNVYEQNQRVRKLALLLGEDENVVKLALGRPNASGTRAAPRRGPAAAAQALAKPAHDSLEAYCIAMLLRYPELAPRAAGLTVEHFSSASFQEIHSLLSSGVLAEDLRVRLPEGLEEELDWLLSYGATLPSDGYRDREHGMNECVKRLEERRLKLQSQALQARFDENDGGSRGLSAAAENLRERLLRNYEKSG